MRGRREHMREEQALVDLDAVLVALRMSRVGADLLLRRDQPRNERRRGVDELVDAAESRAALGQAVVNLFDMRGEERFARRAPVRHERVGSRLFGLVPPRLWRQPAKENRRAAPKGAAVASVGSVVAGHDRKGLRPFAHFLLGQAGGA